LTTPNESRVRNYTTTLDYITMNSVKELIRFSYTMGVRGFIMEVACLGAVHCAIK